jgi:hypothetical protein
VRSIYPGIATASSKFKNLDDAVQQKKEEEIGDLL